MNVRVDELGPTAKHFSFGLEPGSEALEDVPAELLGTLSVSLEVTGNGDEIKVHGRLEGEIARNCDRCLKSIPSSLNEEFVANFITPAVAESLPEGEIPREDLITSVLTGDSLDFSEVVREQLLVSLPDSVLCKDACEGLCLACGGDLNEAECGCEADEIDPRWKGLESLKRDLEK
jgi:uncharacterized protein